MIEMENAFGLGLLSGTAIALVLLIAVFFLVISYVYFGITYYTIAKKLKHKQPWLAWIPFANVALIFQLGGFHWAHVFWIFLPYVGFVVLYVLTIISFWKILEKRGLPGPISLLFLLGGIGAFIVAGIAAWVEK